MRPCPNTLEDTTILGIRAYIRWYDLDLQLWRSIDQSLFGPGAQVATGFMAEGVAGCEALVFALLSVAPDVPNANDLILRAAVATSNIAEEASLR